MPVKIDWKVVTDNLPHGGISLMRLCVPGGWLVKSYGENEVSMCFYRIRNMNGSKIYQFNCLRCAHVWWPRSPNVP